MNGRSLAAGILVASAVAACGGDGASSRATDDMEAEMSSTAPVDLAAVRRDVFGNAWVEAFTLTLEPGQALAPHEGRDRLVYSLGEYTIRYTEGDSTRETSWRTGDVHAHAPGRHAMENIGTTPVRLLMVSRTDEALPASDAPAPTDDLREGATLRLDDDRFRVTEVRVAPGGSRPMHGGLPRLVYALSDYTLRFQAEGGEPVEGSATTGEAHWHDAGRHAIENTGSTEAHFLIVQFKR